MPFKTLIEQILPLLQAKCDVISIEKTDRPDELVLDGTKFSVYRHSLRKTVSFYDIENGEREIICPYKAETGNMTELDTMPLVQYLCDRPVLPPQKVQNVQAE